MLPFASLLFGSSYNAHIVVLAHICYKPLWSICKYLCSLKYPSTGIQYQPFTTSLSKSLCDYQNYLCDYLSELRDKRDIGNFLNKKQKTFALCAFVSQPPCVSVRSYFHEFCIIIWILQGYLYGAHTYSIIYTHSCMYMMPISNSASWKVSSVSKKL